MEKNKEYFADFRNIFFIHLWCTELCARAMRKHAQDSHTLSDFLIHDSLIALEISKPTQANLE